MKTIAPFARPVYVMLKPAGSRCNLACSYCYYLEKSRLYEKKERMMLSDELLERFVRQYIDMQTTAEVLFVWHGGEPMLQPMAFYQKALAYQRMYACGRRIDNCIQTNGTLLTDEWCEFFSKNHFLVGVSIDGPKDYHDQYRRTQAGGPSWDAVVKGISLLEKHGVEWNALATVNRSNVGHPLETYRFFKDIGCRYLQFTPVVERKTIRSDGLGLTPGLRRWASDVPSALESLTDESLLPGQWGDFICAVYDEWVRRDVGRVFVQLFDGTLANWSGMEPGLCTLAATCGHAAAMEFNGDVYACDHFVFPEYKLGNIRNLTLSEMMYGDRQTAFATLKQASLPRQCHECRWLSVCHGECPKNRFLKDCYGETGLNWLCGDYQRYFAHVSDDMEFMKNEFEAGRAPANIMKRGL